MGNFNTQEAEVVNSLMHLGVCKTIILAGTGEKIVIRAANTFDSRSRVFEVTTIDGESRSILLDDIDHVQ